MVDQVYQPDMRQPQAPSYQAYSYNGNQAAGASGYSSSHGAPSTSSTMDVSTLGKGQANAKLLDLIDKLRECHVDQYINLPQIIAVGDQSSGKSSVLEALTGIPFPRASVQCTRFATQITLRRDPALSDIRTNIKIVPYRGNENDPRYRGFKQSFGSEVDFARIFSEATNLICADRPDFLSKDVLVIERSGPQLPHISIIDLPGIIHNATRHQTKADVQAISELSRGYMANKRAIILAVLGCDVEYAKQVIVSWCKEADPQGLRTMGVLTKVDMPVDDAVLQTFLDLAQNKDHRNQLTLGWHALRNRAHNEMHYTTAQRDSQEADYFANSRWRELEPSQLGVEALRKKLDAQLIQHVANEIPAVEDEIITNLERCEAERQRMGPGLETVEQMRAELVAKCQDSSRLTEEALQRNPTNSSTRALPTEGHQAKKLNLNLRSHVTKQNHVFAREMELRGSICDITDVFSDQAKATSSKSGNPRMVSQQQYIDTVVRPFLDDNPGEELTFDFDPLLVYPLFQDFSAPWPNLSQVHVNTVHELCQEFVVETLRQIWPERLREPVWREFAQDVLIARRTSALNELNQLNRDRLRRIKPYSSSFSDKLERHKNDRFQQGKPFPKDKYEHVLVGMLLTYQEKFPVYLDNVVSQVIERHLMDGMREIFALGRVANMAPEDVEHIMAEDAAVQAQRKRLRDQIDSLQKGRDICREISRRPGVQSQPRRAQRGAQNRLSGSAQQSGTSLANPFVQRYQNNPPAQAGSSSSNRMSTYEPTPSLPQRPSTRYQPPGLPNPPGASSSNAPQEAYDDEEFQRALEISRTVK